MFFYLIIVSLVEIGKMFVSNFGMKILGMLTLTYLRLLRLGYIWMSASLHRITRNGKTVMKKCL